MTHGRRATAADGARAALPSPAAAALVAALSLACAACGATTASPVPAPSTTPTTIVAPSASVPSFGAPAAPLPATAANAMANASGACSAFSVLYVRAARTPTSARDATPIVARAQQFASAAATGAPGQWGQLARDVGALVAVVASPVWASVAQQDGLPEVSRVFDDCRSLQ
ncbi:MAG TPA: hypothetical protein VFP61_11525 [Acidimicrobiales bacterium]|nr:hypothetical protein [Acidimicrobiales bacterium]